MTRRRFCLSKANMLIHFIWWGRWDLVQDEWNLTYAQMVEAEADFPRIEREALQRLWAAIEDMPPPTGWKLELAEAVAKEAQDNLNVFSELAELLASHNRRP